jgi:hypothetical protein
MLVMMALDALADVYDRMSSHQVRRSFGHLQSDDFRGEVGIRPEHCADAGAARTTTRRAGSGVSARTARKTVGRNASTPADATPAE